MGADLITKLLFSLQEFTPSFSRRKIQSNWDRYEGLTDENGEEKTATRGVGFNRLLSETGANYNAN